MRARRYGVRLLLGFALLAVAVTSCASGFDAATRAPSADARSLSAGPFVRVGGVLTRYQRWGDHGSPIVLVHGFVESTWAWSRVAPLLAHHHRVYALDLRGFGYSERRGPYTLAGYADQVQAFMRRLGIRRALLVGHSLGAAVVAEVARRDPASVTGLVLANGDARAGGGGPGFVRDLFVDPFASGLIRLVIGSPWMIWPILENAYGPHHPPLTDALVRTWTAPFRVRGSEAALEQMAAGGIPGLSDAQIRSIHVPALAIGATHDRAMAAAVAGLLRAPLVVIPGAAHLALLTDPVPFARAIVQFTSRLPRG
jgi:pimeloyl-ACP methyl ester carboxylesterase